MGNEFSSSTTGLPSELPSAQQPMDCWQTKLDTRPTSLAECIDDDGLKPFSYIHYCQRRSDESESLAQFLESVLNAPLYPFPSNVRPESQCVALVFLPLRQPSVRRPHS
jgi:hypothetical protein